MTQSETTEHLAEVYDDGELVARLHERALVEQFKDAAWCTVEECD